MTLSRPTVMLSANSRWNLSHFRAPILDALDRGGARTVCAVPAGEPDGALDGRAIDLVPVRLDRAGTSPRRDLLLLADYVRAMRAVRPAAYLGFTAKPNIYGALAARACGVPAILNISGLGTGFLGGGLLERVMTSLYRLALSGAATVFFQNEDDRDLFLRRKLVAPAQARVLAGSGIDLDAFAHQPLPATKRGPVVFLLVARMLRDKGVGEFVAAARTLKAEGVDARFVLLGPAGDDNRSAIAVDELAAWQAEGVVEWAGASDDVRPFLADADVVVLPSYREGMPRSLIEAAAVGRPVIASDVPGCRQAVIDGVTGWLCSARDAGSLAAAMHEALTVGPEGRAERGARNRQRAETEFGADAVVRAYREALAACGVALRD